MNKLQTTARPFLIAAGLILSALPVFAQTPSVHIVGVSQLTPASDAMWRSASGKSMDTPANANDWFSGLRVSPAANEQGVRMLVEIDNAPKERSCEVKIDGASRVAWISFQQPGDTRIYAVEASLPADKQTCDVHVGVSKAEWADTAEKGVTSTAVPGTVTGSDGRPRTLEVVFSDFSQFGAELGLSVAMAVTNDQDLRIVGIDNQGAMVVPTTRSDQSVNTVEQRTITFPGKTADDIKTVKLQTRPYEWKDFKGVKLLPTK